MGNDDSDLFDYLAHEAQPFLYQKEQSTAPSGQSHATRMPDTSGSGTPRPEGNGRENGGAARSPFADSLTTLGSGGSIQVPTEIPSFPELQML